MKPKSLSLAEIFSFSESPKLSSLVQEIASRERAPDFVDWGQILPNPDPVLAPMTDGGAAILESLHADAHVMSVVQTRKLGSLRHEFCFIPGMAKGQGQAETRLFEMLQEDLNEIDQYNLISQILDAPYYGMVPMELIWKPGPGRIRLSEIRPLPARWFGFDQANQPRFLTQGNQLQGQPLPANKFVFARHFPTYDNPYGLRLLSRCFWPVTFKKGGIKFWVVLAEKYGTPFLLGKYQPGTTEAEQVELLSHLAKAVRDAVLVVPESSGVELLESSKAAGAGVHRELVEAMNREISKVILGQNLTTEVEGASLAASQTHLGVMQAYLEADQKLVSNVMNEIAKIYGRLNCPEAAAPRFQWFEQSDLKTKLIERDKGLQDLGVAFNAAYFEQTYQLNGADFSLKGTPL